MQTDLLQLVVSKQFFAIPENITIWSILNSQFLVAVVGAGLGFLLNKRWREVKESNEDATDIRLAQQEVRSEDAESRNQPDLGINADLPTGPTPNPPDPRREEALQLVKVLKELVEKRVEKADGRHRRTYDKINRHDYRVLLRLMLLRKDISEGDCATADLAFRLWQPFSKGLGARNPIPKAVVDALRVAVDQLGKKA